MTGEQPIGDRRVDVSKQDEKIKQYRPMLVVKGARGPPMPEMYAATPPSECFRILIADVMHGLCHSDGHWDKTLMVCDVFRA